MDPPHGDNGITAIAASSPGGGIIALSYRRHVVFWVSAFALLLLLLWLLGDILLPFVMGMVLAYLLHPLVNYLERRRVPRILAALLVLTLVLLALVILLLLMAPILSGQLTSLLQSIPAMVRRLQAVLTERSMPWLRGILGPDFGAGDAAMGDLLSQAAGWAGTVLKSLWSGGAALISLFSLLVVTPIVAFYLLLDWDRLVARIDSWVPLHHRETVRELAREIDRSIAGFVRGQSAVCLILGLFYAVTLSMAGLNFGLLIGLISGLIGFIPYVGSLTGLVLSVGVAVAQFWPDWPWISLIVGIFFFGQFVEGNFLQPKLVGESVGLHPVWVIFALFAAGYLFGFVGMLLAVPIAAAIGVLARFGMRQYLQSSLYTGQTTVVITDDTSTRVLERRD